MSDPAHGHYRTKEEIEAQKCNDPIRMLTEQLISEELIDEKSLKDIEDEIDDIIQEAVRFAEESPDPPISSLKEDVYAA